MSKTINISVYDLEELRKENKNLKDDLLHYIQREEEYRKQIDKLKSDLSECECSMHFENDEVWYWKRECKKLKAELDKYKKQYEHSMWDDEEWWSRDEHSYDEIFGE